MRGYAFIKRRLEYLAALKYFRDRSTQLANALTVTYQPGGVANPRLNIFTDWPGAVAAVFAASPVVRILALDGTFTGGFCTIPVAGMPVDGFELGPNVSWVGVTSNLVDSTILLSDGVIKFATNSVPAGIQNIRSQLTSPGGTEGTFTVDASNGAIIYIANFENNSDQSTASGNLFSIVDDGFMYATFVGENALFDSAGSKFAYIGASAFLDLNGFDNTAILPNVLTGPGSSEADIGAGSGCSSTQTGLGTFAVVNATPLHTELSIVAGEQITTSAAFVDLGIRQIDMTNFPALAELASVLGLTITFHAVVDKAAGPTNVTIQLFDLTASAIITNSVLTSTSTTPAAVSAVVPFGTTNGTIRTDATHLYSAQAKRVGGAGSDDVFCYSAYLSFDYA